jgi:hypothetical protein
MRARQVPSGIRCSITPRKVNCLRICTLGELRKVRLKSQFLIVMLLASFSPASLLASPQRHPHWSVDLAKYGYFTGPAGTASALHSDDAVAATDRYVAVAVDVKGTAADPPKMPAEPQSKLSLLIFEADNGKLSAKCGPWTVNSWFDLWPTAGGNFLLHLTPLSDASPQGVETLLLLSPACVRLKQIILQDQGSAKKDSWQTLQSPSRQTLLLIKEQEEGSGYELRGLDTLDLKRQWFEPKSEAPIVIGVSDKGLLGVLPRPMVSETRPIADYYRTFEGNWRLLSVSNYYSFLSDDALVGTKDSAPERWNVSKTQVTAVGLDGTPVFSAVVSGTGYHVERSSDFSVSSDGNHFAFILDFSGAGWLWGNLDMGPEQHSAYVWSVSRASPREKVKLGNWLDHPFLALSFAPDGSWFAVLLDRSRLSIRSLPAP